MKILKDCGKIVSMFCILIVLCDVSNGDCIQVADTSITACYCVIAVLFFVYMVLDTRTSEIYRQLLLSTERVTIHVPMHRGVDVSINDHQCCTELIKVLDQADMDVEIRYIEDGILRLAGNRANIVICSPQQSGMVEKAVAECEGMPRFIKENGTIKLQLREEVNACATGKQYAFVGKTKDFLLIYGLQETGALGAVQWLCNPLNAHRLSKTRKLSHCLIRSDLVNNGVKNPEMYAMATTDGKSNKNPMVD